MLQTHLKKEKAMQSKLQKEYQRHALRLSKILAKKPIHGFMYTIVDHSLCIELGDKKYNFNLAIISSMQEQKYISVSSNNLKLTSAGIAFLKEALNPDALLASAQNKVKSVNVFVDNQPHVAQLNTNESPLLRLVTRKTKTGGTYISLEEFQAGERLRKDFERGQLQPKISASLQGSIGSTGKSGSSGVGDITDFAIDARKRVAQAVERLGPELSGVTLDICCFLKGLEIIERERQWPPRSAKLMLKTALALLARHYGISGYENNHTRKAYSWGATDYRPVLGV